jgi:hypothetical protein
MLTNMADLYPNGYDPFLLSHEHNTHQGYRGNMFHLEPDHLCGPGEACQGPVGSVTFQWDPSWPVLRFNKPEPSRRPAYLIRP